MCIRSMRFFSEAESPKGFRNQNIPKLLFFCHTGEASCGVIKVVNGNDRMDDLDNIPDPDYRDDHLYEIYTG